MIRHLQTLIIAVFLCLGLVMTGSSFISCKSRDSGQKITKVDKTQKEIKKKVKKERPSRPQPIKELNEEQKKKIEADVIEKTKTTITEETAEKELQLLEERVNKDLELENAQ